jgi:hypothetical protein
MSPLMNAWIPVTERLPDDETLVLVALTYQEVWTGYRDGDVWRYVSADIIAEELVTHWMPMPEPPEQQPSPTQEGEDVKTQDDIPAVPGTPFAGGFYAGRILIAGALHALIVAPKAEGEREGAWLASERRVAGADSYCDGMHNTVAMLDAGSELAQWARGLDIGGHTDWYLPSQDELEILYRSLKPTAETNTLYGRSGLNAAAVPPTFAYSRELPAQTTAPGFADNGEQAFADTWYWSSTQHAADDVCAWSQYFGYGYQGTSLISASLRARAVRRLPI